MKLGFAIKIVSGGDQEPIPFNNGLWSKNVVDVRDYLKYFNNLLGTNNYITFLKFTNQGCFLTVLKSIFGRGGDCISGWIYIPKQVVIAGEELFKVKDFVCGILNEPATDERTRKIEEFFKQEYKETEYPLEYRASEGEKLGIRYLNSIKEMANILGLAKYQDYYANYQCIFLCENKANVNPECFNLLEDLTNVPLKEYVVLKAPTGEQLKQWKADCIMFSESGQPFDTTTHVEKGSVIKLTAKRNGFDNYIIPTITAKDCVNEIPSSLSLVWMKTLSSKNFKVVDDKGRRIEKAIVKVNGTVIYDDKTVAIQEKDSNQVKYIVKAKGYDEEQGTNDFTKDSVVNVSLTPEVEEWNDHQIILPNGRKAEITLKGRGLNINEATPLAGYKFNDGKEVYEVDKLYQLKQRLIGGAIATGAIIVLGLGLLLYNCICKTKIEFKLDLPPIAKVKESPRTLLAPPKTKDTGVTGNETKKTTPENYTKQKDTEEKQTKNNSTKDTSSTNTNRKQETNNDKTNK